MSFDARLTNLLKTDQRLVDDGGELILAAVQDRAWRTDRELVRLLLSDGEIKDKFFDEIEGHWIFNTNTFIDFVSQKNFLDNSYTRFRNRIGLTIGGKYLRERSDMALVWPYKDCVLEGGQTGEEEKRREIFFNEVLARAGNRTRATHGLGITESFVSPNPPSFLRNHQVLERVPAEFHQYIPQE